MFRVPLISSNSAMSEKHFWNSLFLYCTSPHLSNRRLLGISPLYILQLKFSHEFCLIRDILKYSELSSKVCKLQTADFCSVSETLITEQFERYSNNFSWEKTDWNFVKKSPDGIFVAVRILLPRHSKAENCLEFVIIDKESNVATFMAFPDEKSSRISPSFPYDIELDKSNLMRIIVSDTETAEEKSSEWLSDVLFPKLVKWSEDKELKTPVQKSLNLVPIEKYHCLYQELKQKYGDNIVKIWPENTDPQKFVYEDVAIATYLLLLWGNLSKSPKKFVDLGCGNGLLVYILTQEGHSGYGIDVRPRKIWKLYPETTELKVETIVPSARYLFPEADWIIGNHSDELTPWVPVISARSSQKCNYFLLPCCSYEFTGKKYQRFNSSKSQYNEYLEYIKEISDTCGFRTQMDRLRIPSTKRVCLIGTERSSEIFTQIDEKITKFIQNRCGNKTGDESLWVEDYEARSQVEEVRNCTKLNRGLVSSIVNTVTGYLLRELNNITIPEGKIWNAGKKVPIVELTRIIPPEELKELKKECGGLQTLLKNHHFIFLVKNGSVQLRIPKENPKKIGKKSRECWFFKNHPDGCPLHSNLCSYIH